MNRLKTISIIGGGGDEPDVTTDFAAALGKEVIARGYALVTGGLGGVMEAAARGAYDAGARGGQIVAILPGHDAAAAHPWASVVIPTGLGEVRNSIVAHSDAVIAVGGGAGTLSELALAWKFDRLIVAIDHPEIGGWSGELAGRRVDERQRDVSAQVDMCHPARSAAEALDLVDALLPSHDEQSDEPQTSGGR